MARLTSDDIIDELIKSVVVSNTAFLENVDDYLIDLVQSFDSSKGIESIPTPMPYKVKQLAIAKCCYDVCTAKFGGQTGVYFKGQEGEDRWYTKLKFYKSELSSLEAGMTLELLTGTEATGKSYSSIPIARC